MRINENIFSSSFVQDCSIILAGKCDRVASVSFNENAVVVETSYQMLEVLSMRSRLLKPPSLKTTVFIFLVEKCKMKLSGVPFFIEYVKRKLLGKSRPPSRSSSKGLNLGCQSRTITCLGRTVRVPGGTVGMLSRIVRTLGGTEGILARTIGMLGRTVGMLAGTDGMLGRTLGVLSKTAGMLRVEKLGLWGKPSAISTNALGRIADSFSTVATFLILRILLLSRARVITRCFYGPVYF